MTIQVRIKNVYGNDLIYPVCGKAKLLLSLSKNSTFTHSQIETIKSLGYTVEVVQEVRSL